MIINTGMRTDIPAFFSEWFINRIREGYVCTRNPYYKEQVICYKLNPNVVDCIAFCTKNPEPMLKHLDEISIYKQFWFVTITSYGKDIEANVPSKVNIMNSFKTLSKKVGVKAVSWRYDPIFISDKYSVRYHIKCFEKMAAYLEGYVDNCVISFIDLYEKTKRNFPMVREVSKEEQEQIGEAFAQIGKKHGIKIRSCCEGTDLKKYGVDVSGCMTQEIVERAIGAHLRVPKKIKSPREACNCLLGNDIGMYNTCAHGCIYCYANYNKKIVNDNMKLHDVNSPFLIDSHKEGDIIKDANQVTYIDEQIQLHF